MNEDTGVLFRNQSFNPRSETMAMRKAICIPPIVVTGLLAACGSSPALLEMELPNILPAFVKGGVRSTSYDGNSDDLLTGGLGASGLASASAPDFVNQANPAAAELPGKQSGATIAHLSTLQPMVAMAPFMGRSLRGMERLLPVLARSPAWNILPMLITAMGDRT